MRAKKFGQRSVIDEEAFVVFCIAAYVQFCNWRLLEHSKKNDVTVRVLLRGM